MRMNSDLANSLLNNFSCVRFVLKITGGGILILALCSSVLLPDALGQIELNVKLTERRAVPVAVTELHSDDASLAQLRQELPALIRENLSKTGLLRLIPASSYPQTAKEIVTRPDFQAWSFDRIQALMTGELSLLPDGRMQANVWLYDVPQGKEIFGLSYSAKPESWRRIGHIISDEIYERLTGETGLFDSRIVYVSESGPQTRRIKRLAMMDQDGGNHQFLTDGSQLVLTPRFSPTRQEITYISYEDGLPSVRLLNLATGQHESLGNFYGRTMSFSPRFSPGGKIIIMSLAIDGNTDLYVMNLETRQVTQLTTHSGIDTSASFSPDRKRIVFNSDRGGSQQIYIMDADGGQVERISRGKGTYATPVWSPKGDKIAYTHILGDRFGIGIMDSDGSNERLLSTGFLVEGPEWSPNGRLIVYFKQDKAKPGNSGVRTRLYMVDTFSFVEREIPTPFDASDPTWSSLLPR